MRGWRPGHGHDRREAQLAAALLDVGPAELDELLRGEERLVLVLFWTQRCEPCRELRRELEGLAGDHVVVAVEADRAPEAVRRHAVSDFPTLAFFKRGRELRRFRSGALPASTAELLG